ncbi:hypothetical protein DL98DRAFT_442512, partial [Cadophora sp. DSE1049]
PCPYPYPLTLFSLIPNNKNKRAKDIISYPNNSHLILILSNSKIALDISFYIRKKSSKALVTLRYNINTNIYIKGSSIIKI